MNRTGRTTDEHRCPICGSSVVGENRDEDNVLDDLWTACGSEWHDAESLYVHSTLDRDPGWTHNMHACRLILGLQALVAGARHELGAKVDQLLTTQQEYVKAVRQVERAVRLLMATGMTEYEARLELDHNPKVTR